LNSIPGIKDPFPFTYQELDEERDEHGWLSYYAGKAPRYNGNIDYAPAAFLACN
jgi:hypothetical protein